MYIFIIIILILVFIYYKFYKKDIEKATFPTQYEISQSYQTGNPNQVQIGSMTTSNNSDIPDWW
jgi:hypothetical protein